MACPQGPAACPQHTAGPASALFPGSSGEATVPSSERRPLFPVLGCRTLTPLLPTSHCSEANQLGDLQTAAQIHTHPPPPHRARAGLGVSEKGRYPLPICTKASSVPTVALTCPPQQTSPPTSRPLWTVRPQNLEENPSLPLEVPVPCGVLPALHCSGCPPPPGPGLRCSLVFPP